MAPDCRFPRRVPDGARRGGLCRRWVPGIAVLVLFLGGMMPADILAQSSSEPDNIPDDALYRYVNADGILVIDFSLPPQYADKGYEILSSSGMLIERVPARSEHNQLTEEEMQALQERKKEDAYILRIYSSVEDVQQARERRLGAIEREIAILKTNLADQSKREAELKERAAAYQASGQETPPAIARVLSDIKAQQQNTSSQLEERREQYLEAARRYDRHARRLVELRPDKAVQAADASEKFPQK